MPVNMRHLLKCRGAIGLPDRQSFRCVNPANHPSDFADRVDERGGRVLVKIIDLLEMIPGNDQDVPFVLWCRFMNARVDSSSYIVTESNSPRTMRQKTQSLSCSVMDLSRIALTGDPPLVRYRFQTIRLFLSLKFSPPDL